MNSKLKTLAACGGLVATLLPQTALALDAQNAFATYEKTLAAAYDWNPAINRAFVESRAMQATKRQTNESQRSTIDAATIGSVIVSPGGRVTGPIIINVSISQPLTIVSRREGQ